MIITQKPEIQKEQHAVAEGTFLLVKVGSESRPATAADIEDIKKNLEGLGIHTWSQKIKSGGLLMGHDYCKSSVKRAVDEYFEEHDLAYQDVVDSEKNIVVNAEDNTIWWRQKNSGSVI